MSISGIIFAAGLLLGTAISFAMFRQDLAASRTRSAWFGERFTQSGDTSLGRNSVNWMAGIAIALAVWVCFFLL